MTIVDAPIIFIAIETLDPQIGDPISVPLWFYDVSHHERHGDVHKHIVAIVP